MSKTYLVTGANRGLGLEFAKQLSARGDRVLGTARDPESATELRKFAETVYPLDVASGVSIETLGRTLADEKIDVLINNGGAFPHLDRIDEMDFEALLQTFAVNSVGPMRVIKAMLGCIRRADSGKIVNISTTMASLKGATGGSYAYRSSKTALNMLTRILAIELRPEGIPCLALHPGWVQTRMGGEQAPLMPKESIEGMLSVIDGLSMAQSGSFLDYKGETVAW